MRHLSTTSLRSAALLLACGAVLGCGDPLSPMDVAGTYALRSIDGQSLPLDMPSSPGVHVVLLAETLRLRHDRTGSLVTVREIEEIGTGAGPSEFRSERSLGFRLVDGRVEITLVCGPAELCAAPPHLLAWRSPGGLHVQYPGGGATLAYERVPGA